MRNTKSLTSVDRLFLSNDKSSVKNPYEEDFYPTEDLTSFFSQKKPNHKKPPKLHNPAFFSIYGEDDYVDPDEEEMEAPKEQEKKKSAVKKKKKKTDRSTRSILISLSISLAVVIALVIAIILIK